MKTVSLVGGARAAGKRCGSRRPVPAGRIGVSVVAGVLIALLATGRAGREPRFRELGLLLGG